VPPRSQAHPKSSLEPSPHRLPPSPPARTRVVGARAGLVPLLLAVTDWDLTDPVRKLGMIFYRVFACYFTLKLAQEQANCAAGLQTTSVHIWVGGRAVFALALWRALPETWWKAPKLSLHKSTKNASARDFHPARKPACGSPSIQWHCPSAQDRHAAAVAAYDGSAAPVLRPASRGAAPGHQATCREPPDISGYGNLSQDYGFIISQPGNFSLSGSLKLVSAGQPAAQWHAVSFQPTLNKRTERSRVL